MFDFLNAGVFDFLCPGLDILNFPISINYTILYQLI
jgi:hypothetical protein